MSVNITPTPSATTAAFAWLPGRKRLAMPCRNGLGMRAGAWRKKSAQPAQQQPRGEGQRSDACGQGQGKVHPGAQGVAQAAFGQGGRHRARAQQDRGARQQCRPALSRQPTAAARGGLGFHVAPENLGGPNAANAQQRRQREQQRNQASDGDALQRGPATPFRAKPAAPENSARSWPGTPPRPPFRRSRRAARRLNPAARSAPYRCG